MKIGLKKEEGEGGEEREGGEGEEEEKTHGLSEHNALLPFVQRVTVDVLQLSESKAKIRTQK